MESEDLDALYEKSGVIERGAPNAMERSEPPINWDVLGYAGEEGQLLDLLVKVPRARWTERNQHDTTLLHFACFGPNVAAVVALLTSGLVDVNAVNKSHRTPASVAATHAQPRVLEVLCAAGANLRVRDEQHNFPLDDVVQQAAYSDDTCARVLVANGVRLSTVSERFRHLITPELVAFERGVLRCRAAVVAMLRVKRASGQLVRWDKFLLVEVALCIWSTRYNKEWSEN